MIIIGKKAPVFTSQALVKGKEIVNDYSLENFLHKKYVIFYFYPADFSNICPSEVMAFEKVASRVAEMDAVVVGCSTDSATIHKRWLSTPISEGGIEGVTHTLVGDPARTISCNYGVLAGRYEFNEKKELAFYGNPVALRAVYIIDKNGIVRHQVVNDIPFGRNINEIIRMLEAVVRYERNGEECPAVFMD